MASPRTTSKTAETEAPRLGLSDLTAAERAELIAELRASAAVRSADGLERRELTPRERAVRLLLPDRAHFEGCPILEDEARAVGRVEAYAETRPADPRNMTPATRVTVARCMECGGARVHEGTLEANLIAALGDDNPDGADLDASL